MKKIITFLLAIILLTEQTFALSLGDLFYQNKTSASSNKIDGTHYYFGGGYELRFKANTYSFKPWINGQAPNFNIGCNGISISGGFISLLGLNDIKDQLKHASVAFAWGVIMAIKASLPLVAEVFEAIQAWSRTIQKLLQNACQLGQAAANNFLGAKKINNEINQWSSNQGFAKVKNDLNSFKGKATAISNWVDKTISNNGKQPKALAGQLFENIHAISLATMFFGKYLPDLTSINRVIEFGDLKHLYDKKIGDASLLVSNSTEFQQAKLMHELALLCFGEIGITKSSYTSITRVVAPDGKLDTKKLKHSIFVALQGVFKENVSTVMIPPVLSADDVYSFLYSGAGSIKSTSTDSGSCTASTEVCKIPNYKLMYLYSETNVPVDDENNNNDSNSSSQTQSVKKTYKVFALFNYSTGNDIKLKWKGFYQTSLDQIRDAVKVNSGITNYSFFGNAPTTTYSTYSFVLPGMSKYINILALLTKKSKGETQYVYYLEKLLAQRNANTATFLLVNSLDTYIRTLMKNPNVNFSSVSREQLQFYLQNVDTIKKDIEKRIEGKLKIDDSARKMDLMFDEIYKNIKQENLQNVGF